LTPLLDLLREVPWFLYAVTGVLGLLVGSFLNVAIYRLPVMLHRGWRSDCLEFLAEDRDEQDKGTTETEKGKPTVEAQDSSKPGEAEATKQPPFNLWGPPSRCPHCEHQITALENIPVISYLFLGGRCSNCKTSISARYPLIELLTAALSLVVIWHFGPTLQGIAALVLTWVLITLSFIDIDHQLLPDNITLPWLWLGMLLSLFGIFSTPADSIIGALAGYLSLWLVYQTFKLATGKEGMGYGDFKLLALFGAWLGWQPLPLIILLSSLVGAIIGGGMMVIRGQDRSIPIPFGPYLAIAGWVALLWGEQLVQMWLIWVNPA